MNAFPGTIRPEGSSAARATEPELMPAPYLRTGAGAYGVRRTVMGAVLGWPTTDPVTLFILQRLFFKLSRMWAAAHVADGNVEAFCAAVPMPRRFEDTAHLVKVLARFAEKRAAVTAIEAAWEQAFFGDAPVPQATLAALEATRLDARQALNGTRGLFVPYLMRALPRLQLETDTPAQAEAIYGAALAEHASTEQPKPPAFGAFPTAMPSVAVSRTIPGTVSRDHWIRFKSPSRRVGDTVTARVHEPIGIANPPTVILGHGICVEFDHWRGLVDETDELVKRGFRVIRPEAPWHGRRAAVGRYGGEHIVGAFPTGSLDAFSAALQEWAVIADWARSTSSGPLSMGGTSLGAQMAQLVADRSRDWPEHLRPQALLLITHCGSMKEAVLNGAIPQIFGSADDIMAKGWTPDSVTPYLALLDPGRTPPLPPERIVSVMGRYDTVTPFASGEALVRDWGLPLANTFVFDRGHFSVPMTLIRTPAPLDRFTAIVKALG